MPTMATPGISRLERTTRKVIVHEEPPPQPALPRQSGRTHTVYHLPALRPPRA